MRPFSGYCENGKWSPKLNTIITEEKTYTYSFSPKTYSVTYTDGVDDEEIFADQDITDVLLGMNTPAFNGTPTRDGYIFKGWRPEVSETIDGRATYTAQWERSKAVNPTEPTEPPEEKKSNRGVPTENPQTGNNNNLALWVVLMAVSGFGITGTAVYSRKRKATRKVTRKVT